MSSKTKTSATKEAGKPALVPKLRFPQFREAEGWSKEKLGPKSKKVGSGITPTGGDKNYKQSGRPFVRSQNIGWGTLLLDDVAFIDEDTHNSFSSTQIEALDLLLNITGASIGRSALADARIEGGNVNQHVCIIRVKPAELSPFFLNQYLISQDGQKQIDSFQAGGNRQGLNFEQIRSFLIPLPSVLEEQQKIAECLSSVDELIAAQARKLDALKTHKKGLMQQLFPREGETQPRLRFPEFKNAGEWEEDKLIDLATFRRGSFPQPYGLPEWYDEAGGMPFVQVFDVGDNFRLKDKTKNKISKLGAEKSVFIPKGTLIVTLQGSIGRVAITHYDAYIDRTLLIFETFLKPIEKVFFARLIQNLFDIEKEIAPGGIIKTITKEALSDFKVKLPKIEEQQRIGDCLTTLDDLVAAQTQKLDALKTHKQGLMQQLFPSPESEL